MTPGVLTGTILLAALAVVAGFLAVLAFRWWQRERDDSSAYSDSGMALTVLVVLTVIAVGALSTAWIPAWWLHNTEGGQRSLRNYHQTTNVSKSPVRVVKVYSATGQLLATYTGRFDVGHNDGFVDLDIHNADGSIKRVLIDNSAGAMTVEDVTR